MTYEVNATEACNSGIDAQLTWFREDESRGGSALALRWFEALHQAFIKLASHPHAYGFAPENGKWLPEFSIRQMLFRPWKSGAGWRILYVVDEEVRQVSVLQVRHEHRRWLHEDEQ